MQRIFVTFTNNTHSFALSDPNYINKILYRHPEMNQRNSIEENTIVLHAIDSGQTFSTRPGEIVQWVWPIWIRSLAPHMVPQATPGVICKYKDRTKLHALLGVAPNKAKFKKKTLILHVISSDMVLQAPPGEIP